MLGSWQKNCGSGSMVDVPGDSFMTPSGVVQVEGDGSYFAATEEELEVEHLLAEPRNDKILVDGILCFNSGSPVECLAIDDFPCAADFGHMKTDTGMLDKYASEEQRDESKFEFLDGMLHGIEEGDLHIPNSLSTPCDDFLLDTEYDDEIPDLDYGSCKGANVVNLGLESQPSCLSEKKRGSQISESSTVTLPVQESTSDQNESLLDRMTIRELQEAFRTTFGRETSVKDKQWLKRRISFGLENLVEFENVSSLLESGTSSNENEVDMIVTSSNDSCGKMPSLCTSMLGNMAKPLRQDVERKNLATENDLMTVTPEAGKVGLGLGDRGLLVTPKRLRKPTRRYIEESSDLEPRYSNGRLEAPTGSRDKILRAKSHNQNNQKRFGTMSLVCRQDYLGGTGIQVPFGLRVRKGRPKKNTFLGCESENEMQDRLPSVPNRNSYIETSPSESQDDMSDDNVTTNRSGKAGVRRKHHRLWTLSEVMKLIDGVSQYGVGRWTEIKRLLFSSSAYRTSVDLKTGIGVSWNGISFPRKGEGMTIPSNGGMPFHQEWEWDSYSSQPNSRNQIDPFQFRFQTSNPANKRVLYIYLFIFPSLSVHDLSTIQDKWRNLLRASCAQMQSKREVEHGRKHAYRPIPPSVLRRVSELAIIYPYPRERKTKSSVGRSYPGKVLS